MLSRPSYVSHVNVKVVIPEDINGKYEIRGTLRDSYNYVSSSDNSAMDKNQLRTKLYDVVSDKNSKIYRAKVSNIGLLSRACTVLYLTLNIQDDIDDRDDLENLQNVNSERSMKLPSWCGLMVYLNIYSFRNESTQDISMRHYLLTSKDKYLSIIESLAVDDIYTKNHMMDMKLNHEMISCTMLSLDLLIKILSYRITMDSSS